MAVCPGVEDSVRAFINCTHAMCKQWCCRYIVHYHCEFEKNQSLCSQVPNPSIMYQASGANWGMESAALWLVESLLHGGMTRRSCHQRSESSVNDRRRCGSYRWESPVIHQWKDFCQKPVGTIFVKKLECPWFFDALSFDHQEVGILRRSMNAKEFLSVANKHGVSWNLEVGSQSGGHAGCV